MNWELKYDPDVKEYLKGLDEHILSRIEKSAKHKKVSQAGKAIKRFSFHH